MATRKNTDRWALDAAGMANVHKAPLSPQRQREAAAKAKAAAKKGGRRNGR